MKRDNREIKYIPRAMIVNNGIIMYFTSSVYVNQEIRAYDKESGTYVTRYELEFCDKLSDKRGVEQDPILGRSRAFETAEACNQYLVVRNKQNLDRLIENNPQYSDRIIKSFHAGLAEVRELEQRILEERAQII